MMTTAIVQILVRDDNDNTPVFSQDVYTFVTEEEAVQTTRINLGVVRADDLDRVDAGQLHLVIIILVIIKNNKE